MDLHSEQEEWDVTFDRTIFPNHLKKIIKNI